MAEWAPPKETHPDSFVHATCLAIDGRGVLLRGASGSGKSDLALRAIDGEPGGSVRLVADDRVHLVATRSGITASPMPGFEGLLEVRGLGIARVPWMSDVPICLILDLVERTAVPRLPAPAFETVLGAKLPLIPFDPFAASAPAKLKLAVRRIGQDGFPGDNGIL